MPDRQDELDGAWRQDQLCRGVRCGRALLTRSGRLLARRRTRLSRWGCGFTRRGAGRSWRRRRLGGRRCGFSRRRCRRIFGRWRSCRIIAQYRGQHDDDHDEYDGTDDPGEVPVATSFSFNGDVGHGGRRRVSVRGAMAGQVDGGRLRGVPTWMKNKGEPGNLPALPLMIPPNCQTRGRQRRLRCSSISAYNCRFSNTPAAPIPPPIHMVTMP